MMKCQSGRHHTPPPVRVPESEINSPSPGLFRAWQPVATCLGTERGAEDLNWRMRVCWRWAAWLTGRAGRLAGSSLSRLGFYQSDFSVSNGAPRSRLSALCHTFWLFREKSQVRPSRAKVIQQPQSAASYCGVQLAVICDLAGTSSSASIPMARVV